MWRYTFTKKNIDAAKAFLESKTGKEPAFLKKYKGTVKSGTLYLDGKEVIDSTKAETLVRNKVLSGKVPLSRDGLYYFFSKQTVGIRRAVIDNVLKGQRVIRETDNNKPRTTKKPRRVNKKGQISFDLIDVRFKDLGRRALTHIEGEKRRPQIRFHFFMCGSAYILDLL